MSSKARKARKRAGEKAPVKPAKVPTGIYQVPGERKKAVRAMRKRLDAAIREAAQVVKEEVDGDA